MKEIQTGYQYEKEYHNISGAIKPTMNALVQAWMECLLPEPVFQKLKDDLIEESDRLLELDRQYTIDLSNFEIKMRRKFISVAHLNTSDAARAITDALFQAREDGLLSKTKCDRLRVEAIKKLMA
eukprot:530989_1